GHFPEIAHPGGLLGVGGPMARDAADLRVLFEVLAGYDCEDPFSAPVPLRSTDLKGLRIGVMEQWPGVPVQPVVAEAVRRAADALAGL
ncbi:MAG TPA: amidase, partial [Solibacterales bacterium]|nr:amidase [Bryobacterales bacterium]